jgi:hypothetical protein
MRTSVKILLVRSSCLLLVAGLVGCPSHDTSKRSRAIVLLQGAKAVEYASFGREENVAYDILPPLSLQSASDFIDDELRADGWARSEFFPPGEYAQKFVDVRHGGRDAVEQWGAKWRRGDAVAEYILERHADRLHVWGRVGPPEGKEQVKTASSTAAPAPAVTSAPSPRVITVSAADIALICDDSGSAAISFSNVDRQSATASWRFRGRDGHESTGVQNVREQHGSKPNELDVSSAEFRVGTFRLRWAPAQIVMAGTSTRPETVTSATSYLYYPANAKAMLISGQPIGSANLATVGCH